MISQQIAKPGDRIVDFCCGSGHLGIVVAHCLPRCQVVLLDNKEESLARAWTRVNRLALSNVTIIQCNLDYFKGSFQVQNNYFYRKLNTILKF